MALLLAATVTPLRDRGAAVDEDAIAPLCAFLASGGADGVFALGTTGEGVLLSLEERRRAAAAFREACTGTLIVHCGAQSTADTCALAAHAASIGADGVAVIPPPYYAFPPAAVLEHLAAAASACTPVPFYPYAFAARSGYALEPEVVTRLRDRAGNLAGMKVSESPFERVEPYLGLGLPVFVGAEALIPRALAAGAAGAVSGLAAAFPDVVSAVVRDPDEAGAERLRELRSALERHPFQAALKAALGARGVPVRPDVRPPLPGLDVDGARAVAELGGAAFVN
ncbi:MAG TPA: dihydrodipicolinate synthase family protein [Gaiellales bacterium]|jgi:dihydrodipicolinate synthase/N-acetylneuraminate lyase|nr:dihydrodipicolinate synthase family protein [Gaiellales bacterium]